MSESSFGNTANRYVFFGRWLPQANAGAMDIETYVANLNPENFNHASLPNIPPKQVREIGTLLIQRGEREDNYALFKLGQEFYHNAIRCGDNESFDRLISLLNRYNLSSFTVGSTAENAQQLYVPERHFNVHNLQTKENRITNTP